MIKIQNIYYMLAYAFKVLNGQGYKKLSTEKFDNATELCAAILAKGISTQVKRGLGREYIPKTEALSSLRGKLDISESIKTQTFLKKQMICSYDDFSVDSIMNRIIKSTVLLLLKKDALKSKKELEKELKKLMVFFADVSEIDLHSVNWNMRYNRNNQTYQMLIFVCEQVFKGLLQTTHNGTKRMLHFDERMMHKLYERFILEYFRKEHPELNAKASKISWQLDKGSDEMLPEMKTDIMLTKGEKILIIDAKYYEHTTQQHYNKKTLHSGNLYQIFTYVKNKETEMKKRSHKAEASGMLLYAKTDEETYPENVYQMSGNRIEVKTLDLNADFDKIKDQLEDIAEKYFGANTEVITDAI